MNKMINKIINKKKKSFNLPSGLPQLPSGFNAIFMADLLKSFKSMPPELLQQSMKKAQNMDMSKVDIGKMMGDMNKIISQFGTLQNLQKQVGGRKMSRKLKRRLNKIK